MSFLKEPVFHFALLGLALFFYFDLTSDDPMDEIAEDRLEISEADAAQLIGEYTTLWRRPPTATELETLIEAKIREEILVREALGLGLDRNDTVIRNRLRQKMQFLIESAAQSLEPSDADLQSFLDEHAERFERDGLVAFAQVLLPDGAAQDDIAAALEALNSGTPPEQIGERTLLPAELPLTPLVQTDGIFGRGFADNLAGAEPGIWFGPVASGYGAHLIRITAWEPSRLPDLSEIRNKVETEWRQARADELVDAQIDALLANYEVGRPDDAALDRLLTQ